MSDLFDTDAINASINLPQFVALYADIKPRGKEYVGLCPFHDDSKPSFTVYEKNGKWSTKCFACGESHNGAIAFLMAIENIDFVAACKRLTNGDALKGNPIAAAPLRKPPKRVTLKPPSGCLLPPFESIRRGEPVSTHPYLDADTELIGYAAYYRDADRPVYWTWGKYSDDDLPKWDRKLFAAPFPIYGLEQLSRKPAAQVIVTTDERAADAAQSLFPIFACIAWCGDYDSVDWSPLAGRKTVIMPRANEHAQQEADRLALMLHKAGAAEVKGIVTETLEKDGATMETPADWSIADMADVWTPAEALAWAKSRITIYPFPDPNPDKVGHVAPQQDAPERDLSDLKRPEDTAAPPKTKKHATRTPRQPEGHPETPVSAPPNAPTIPREISPVMELPPEFSEYGLADRFVTEFGDDWRFTREWNTWFRWNGGYWERDKSSAITYAITTCVNAARAIARQLTEAQHNRICTYKMNRSIEMLVSANPKIAVVSAAWDSDPWSLGTPAGVVNLKTGELYDAPREAFVSRAVSVVPAAGETPLFDSVIARATQGDADLEQYLWRWFGYILTGDVTEESFLFIHGSGGSGKSTLIKTLASILGDYARSCKPAMFEETKHEGHPTELAELAGSRLAYASESSEGARFAEAKIKWLTGGDTISAHFMRQDNFQFVPSHKILIHGNHMPQLRSVGEEMRRRIHLVEFPGSIPESERDKKLKSKLEAEYPAILHRMIQGCLAWQKRGLGKPSHVTAATDDYLQGEDTLGAWIADCIDLGPKNTARSAEVYRSFKKWAEQSGEFCPSQKRFSRSLIARGHEIRRTAAGSVIYGLSVKQSDVSGGYGYD